MASVPNSMRSYLLSALFIAGCSATAPRPAPVEPAPAQTETEGQGAEEGEYYVVREGEYNSGTGITYQLSVNTPEPPQSLLDDLAARYGEPDQRAPVFGSTWRGVTFEGIAEPVDLTVGVNEVRDGATTLYTTFMSMRSSGGGDLLVSGSATQSAAQSYLRRQVSPASRSLD